MTDKETLNVYNARAADYAELVTRTGPNSDSLQDFIDALPADGHVLDLGCGPGDSAARIAAAGHRVTATDASEEMVALAAQQDGVSAHVASFDDIAGTAEYDGIWANFSLLHAPRDAYPKHWKAMAQALKPGGVFHIGMKTGTGSKRDKIGRVYTYVTLDELEALCRAVGLVPVSHRTGAERGLDGEMAAWVTLLARKDG